MFMAGLQERSGLFLEDLVWWKAGVGGVIPIGCIRVSNQSGAGFSLHKGGGVEWRASRGGGFLPRDGSGLRLAFLGLPGTIRNQGGIQALVVLCRRDFVCLPKARWPPPLTLVGPPDSGCFRRDDSSAVRRCPATARP